jgi:oligoendopeptidase F
MELLAAPYLTADKGGYYAEEADAARARIEHLEGIIQFWPYMSVVDSFQHWAYTHPEDALKPDRCDETWGNLWQRFMSHQDWSGLEEERVTGWHRKLHIFEIPFYYVEYGMAQLGAVQVWGNALKNHTQALKQYREALALGDTAPLPVLFETAGAKFRFDAETLNESVTLLMDTIDHLDSQLAQ